jgi:ABC-2 type transport system ATP-binding protein
MLINAGKIIAEGNPTELKTKYLNHDIIEIECTNAVSAMEVLEKTEFVNDISIFGNNIHLSVDKDFENYNLIKDQIIDISEVRRIEKIVPTLEDVFINLLEKTYNK